MRSYPAGLGIIVVLIALSHAAAAPIVVPGPGWMILRVDADEPFTLVIDAKYEGPGVLFIVGYHANGTGFFPAARQTEATGGRLSVGFTGENREVEVYDDLPQSLGRLGEGLVSGTGLGLIFMKPGKYLFVAGAGGEIRNWTVSTEGAPPAYGPTTATPMELERGGDVHWRASPDESIAHARAAAVYNAADAQVGSTLRMNAENTFVGFFDDWGIGVGNSTLATPHGAKACPCTTGKLSGAGADGPGEYVLSATGAHARFNQPPLAFWLDPPLRNYVEP